MSETTTAVDRIPTHDELTGEDGIIATIIGFLKEIIALFDKIKEGLTLTFKGYERQY